MQPTKSSAFADYVIDAIRQLYPAPDYPIIEGDPASEQQTPYFVLNITQQEQGYIGSNGIRVRYTAAIYYIFDPKTSTERNFKREKVREIASQLVTGPNIKFNGESTGYLPKIEADYLAATEWMVEKGLDAFAIRFSCLINEPVYNP